MTAKRLIYIIACLAALGGGLFAQTETWQWVQTAGTPNNETGISIAVHGDGFSYIAGTFADSLVFGDTVLHSQGDTDIFVAKLDSALNWVWAKSCGSADAEYINSIAADPSGNVFITGSFYYSAFFGTTSLTSAGDYDIYVAKLDSSGNWLWAVNAGGSSYDEARDIACDSAGNAYLTGSVWDNAYFGSIQVSSWGDVDAIVAKIDPAGTWQWCKHAGGFQSDYGIGINVDASANVYVTGSFSGVGNFGTVGLESVGYHDIFAAKLNSSGDWLWIRQAGGEFEDWGHKIYATGDTDVYVVGVYRSSAAFGIHFLESITGAVSDIFVAKIGTGNEWEWANKAGGYDYIIAGDICPDNLGNLYVGGYFRGTAVFGEQSLISLGQFDAFLAKINPEGDWAAPLQAGGAGNDYCNGIVSQGASLYLTGSFSQNAGFDDITPTNAGGADVFVAMVLANTSVEDDLQTAPPAFLLESVSPNPFSSSVTLDFSVAKAGDRFTLSIYDLRGRRVAILLNSSLASGTHSVVWDGRDDRGSLLPSGMYFARLQNGSRSSARKLLLIR